MAVLYLETNYLMGVATGRYPPVDALISGLSLGVSVAIPSACIAEAFAALEGERNKRFTWASQLDYQISQLRGGVELSRALKLLSLLEAARLENRELINDFETRLFVAIDQITRVADLIDPGAAVIQKAVHEQLSEQPTDNFIIHCVLEHARRSDDKLKALFSGNIDDFRKDDAGRALIGAGVRKFFRSYMGVIRWLKHMSG